MSYKDTDEKTMTDVNEPWRNEVASRVNSYKARREQRVASLPLDFAAPKAAPTQPPAPSSPYDTNYYRRVNAATRGVELSGAMQGAYVPTANAPDYSLEHVEEPAPTNAAASYANPFAPQSATSAAAPVDQRVPASLLEPAPSAPPVASAPVISAPPVAVAPPPTVVVAAPVMAEAAPVVEAKAVIEAQAADTVVAAAPEEKVEAGGGAIDLEAPAAEAAEAVAEAARQDNLIEFPRAAMEPPLAPEPPLNQLAEPVFASPRILDVPEMMTPEIQGNLFDGLTLDSTEELSSQPAPHQEAMPSVPMARMGERAASAMIDLLLIAGATMLFLAIAHQAIFDMPKKLMLMVAALIPVILWSLYQYVFFSYIGRTMGMEMLRLRLRTLSGRRPGPRARRRRAVCTVLSVFSLGVSHLWALIDERGLCWHDHHSRTFVERMP